MREEFVMKTVDSVVVGGKCYQSYKVECDNVDWVYVAEDREVGQSFVVVGMNFERFGKFGNILRS